MNIDAFAKKLSGEENAVSRDEAKLAHDEIKADTFESKLSGQGNAISQDLDRQYGPPGAPPPPDTFANRLGAGARDVVNAVSDYGIGDAVTTAINPMGGMSGVLGSAAGNAVGRQFSPSQMPPSPPAMAAPPGPGPGLPPGIMSDGQGPPPGLIGPPPPPPGAIAPAAPTQLRPPGAGGPNLQGAVDRDNKALLGNFDQQGRDLRTLTQAQVDKNDAFAREQELEGQRQIRAQQDADAVQAHTEDLQSQYQTRANAINDKISNSELQPDRLYKNADTGTKIGLALGAFFGGIVPGVKPLMKMMGADQDQDIAVQKDAYERKRAGQKQSDTLYGHFMDATKDSRLAEMESRNAYMSANKAMIQGRMATMDNPIQKALAQQALTGISNQQEQFQKGLDVERLRAAQQQAGAAAAERRRLEQQAWDRSMQMGKMGIEGYQAETARMKEAGDKSDKTAAGQAEYAKRLGDDKAISADVSSKNLARQITNPDGSLSYTKGIAGVGPSADFRAAIAPKPSGLNAILNPLAAPLYMAAGLKPNEVINRQDWNAMRINMRHDISGASFKPEEAAEIDEAFSGADHTPAGQANAIAKARAVVERHKALARAGFPAEVTDAVDSRLSGGPNPEMPASVRPKR